MQKKGEKQNFTASRHAFYMLGILFRYEPAYVITSFVVWIFFRYMSWAVYTLIFTARLFKYFAEEAPMDKIITIVVFYLSYLFVAVLVNTWYEYYYSAKKSVSLNYSFSDMLYKKVSQTDAACYETPDFYNVYIAALRDSGTRAEKILNDICSFTGQIINSVIFMTTLVIIDYGTLFFIVFPVMFGFIARIFLTRLEFEYEMAKIPPERKRDYVQRTVMLKKHAKDMRMTNLIELFKRIYSDALNQLFDVVKKYSNRLYFRSSVHVTVGLPLSFYPGWIYAAYKIMVAGTLQMEDYIIIANAIVAGRNTLDSFFTDFNRMIQHGLYAQNFKKMMEYKPKIDENAGGLAPAEKPESIEFKNVTFYYENQKKPVLKNISFKINLNTTVALLGHNGAGKSTLVKLIMRLYDTSEGEILLDGVNIKEYDVIKYRRMIGTVFQQPQLFAVSLRDNIIMGCGCGSAEETEKRLEEAVVSVGLGDRIDKLPKKFDTVVTKEFDETGVEFSGGEYQKIAIARAVFRQSSVLILDEPSSSLDPIAEYEMYENIKNLYSGEKNKIVFLISHRMSCALLADRVILLENGEIVESGTHETLMAQAGKYSHMFLSQKKSYEYGDTGGEESE